MTQGQPLTGTHEEIKAQLREEFPRWSIISTQDTGRWWATRGPLVREELSRTSDLDADSPEELRAELIRVDQAR